MELNMENLLKVLSEVRDDVDFAHEAGLVDEGVIDSLDITAIISAVADSFGVRISAGEIEPENFNTAAAILETIRRAGE